MNKKAAILLSILLLIPGQAGAQRIHPADTASAFRATQLIAPAVLIGSGLSIHYFGHDTRDIAIRDKMLEWSSDAPDLRFDDYIQYVPVAMDLGLGLAGLEARHCFIDRTIEAALAYASCGIISWSSKSLFHTMRPNGANTQSFPSGHCSTVFCGAELVRREYGWQWGIGAYFIATTVAVMRMYRNWHWYSDVLAGAGVGILSANIGCWLLEPTRRLFRINLSDKLQFGIVPAIDPVSGIYGSSFAMRF